MVAPHYAPVCDILSDAPGVGLTMRGLKLLTVVCAFSTALFAADDPFIGTWKLNVEKSKFKLGHPTKEMTVTFEPDGSDLKRTATGVDPDGEPIKQNGTVPWDAMDHKVDAPGITVAVKKINDHSVEVTVKHEGKIVSSGRTVVSKDGKTMTATEKGEDPKGRPFDNVTVFEKQ
jgi:hypothetical protein